VIALAAGVVFNFSWLVVILYLILVVMPSRHHMDTTTAAPVTPSVEPPSRPFKDPPA
jgi:hypothetical protein